MSRWQILTKDIVMEQMLELNDWVDKVKGRKMVEIVTSLGYVVEAIESDIRELCSEVQWIEFVFTKKFMESNEVFLLRKNN